MKKTVSLAFLGLFVLMISCEKDIEHSHQHEAKIARELQINDLPPLLRNDIQNKKQSNAPYRTTQDYLDLVNYDNITEITQSNGNKTFTFGLNLFQQDTLTNLVVTQTANSYEYNIITYSSSELGQWKEDIINKQLTDISVDINIIPLYNETPNVSPTSFDSGETCLVTSFVCPSGMHNTSNMYGCIYDWSQWSTIVFTVYCDDQGYFFPGGGGSSPQNPNPTNPGNGDPYTEPIVLNPNFVAVADFIGSLPNGVWDSLDFDTQTDIQNYLLQNVKNNVVKPHAQEFVKNLIQLYIELENNPSFLLEIPYTQLQKWQQLVQHQVPQSVINKIIILNQNSPFGDFQIQYLEEAKGNVINLDYFSVNITSLPNNPLTGVQFTPEGFLNHIRLNINGFINTNYSEFSPSTITGMNEAQIWNSNDPLSAIIHIDIPAPAGDGSVICSQHDSNSWIFTTIEVPWRPFLQEYDGIHPVSGHRQFGIVQNSNGSYSLFTRGVDRMTDKAEAFFAETFIEYPFEAPDNLWNSFREGVYNFVNNNGGNASSLNLTPPEIWRPNWNKVKEVLQGLRPISDLETD